MKGIDFIHNDFDEKYAEEIMYKVKEFMPKAKLRID